MTLPPGDRAYLLVNGFRATQAVDGAAELKIPDLLAGGPRPVAVCSCHVLDINDISLIQQLYCLATTARRREALERVESNVVQAAACAAAVAYRPASSIVQIGLTSIAPSSAPGQRAAQEIAASRSGASMRK